jgi:predicted enzyme related to lactoylglutathione lyase
MTTDVEKASEFYAELFGWEFAPVDMGGRPAGEGDGEEDEGPQRVSIKNGERLNGGIATLPESAAETAPPHWLPYFAVDDLQAAVSAVDEGGGTVMADPIEVPAGRFAVVADPQGAVFAVFAGEFDD